MAENRISETDTRERMVLRILRVADMVTRIGSMSVFGETLTQPQFNILMILRRFGTDGASQKDILEFLVSTKGNVSIHIANLAKSGFIKKRTSTADARANVITLTAKGRSVLDELEPRYFEQIQKMTGDLPEDEVETTLKLLDCLKDRCEQRLGIAPGQYGKDGPS